MKFGLAFANIMHFGSGEGAKTIGRSAEAAGFDSVWTVEHIIYPEGYKSTYPYDESGKMPGSGENPIPDPLIWLGFVAAHTKTLRLATGISLLPERSPVSFAKEVATLDNMSGGRVELGVGIGWLKEEFAALGVPWERRGARTEEYIEVMRLLWAEDAVSFQGEFVSFGAISCNPKPASRKVPIHIGGHSRAAAERAGRVGDGFWPAKGDLRELFDIACQTASAYGRDPALIELTGQHPGIFGDDPQAAVEELASWGANRIVVPSFLFARDTTAALAAWGDRVIAKTLV
ncbi:MAG: LLM class F420-dependent oxidoreductase [Acidimicrobiia bacterium]|nr:LLM class F420-dependent oxidoreductase [Acidimicrobiia bacterium]MCY4456964.1 LLM class F420-dependent oxidoreductase [Acidimicrobiaceae bacterium]